jgi:Peptidase family S41
MRNGARKTFAWLVFSILMTTCRAQSVPGPTCGSQFDLQPWLEDLGQLTAEMAAHYANLESSQRERHMDLPLRYSCSESTGRLPLYVLVDRETWSAAEYFAAILQDNKAASGRQDAGLRAPARRRLGRSQRCDPRHSCALGRARDALHESRKTVPCSERGFGRGELQTLKA